MNMKNILSEFPMRRTSPVDDVFTLFVILPTEEVCTLRHLQSGISVEEVKSRLELAAGLPSQIYHLVYPDGECLGDKKSLLIQKNVRDGYILRVVLHENWESLYHAIFKNHIEHVCHGEALNVKGNIAMNAEDAEKVEGIVTERRTVALYIACFLGHIKMCNTLLSIGADVNGTTPFGRTALHATACRDNVSLVNLLVERGASVTRPDSYGRTPADTALEYLSKLCVKRLRLMQLNLRGESKHFHERNFHRVPSAEPPRAPTPPSEPVEPLKITRSITITLPTDTCRNTKSPQPHAESRTESRNSESRPTVNVSTPLHPWDTLPTRKSIFAADNMFSPRFLTRFNNNTKRGQKIMMERQNKKQKEYLNSGEANSKLLGQQLSILRSKRTLKFANEDDRKNEDQSEASGSVYSTTTSGTPYVLAPPVSRATDVWRMEKYDKSDDSVLQPSNPPVKDLRKVKIDLENQTLLPPTPVPPRQKSARHVRFSGKARSSSSKQLAVEDFRNMKRKINLVASHQNGQVLKTKFRYGDTYEKWLMKKKLAERRKPKVESSSEDESDSDSDAVNSEAYTKWLDDKKHNKTKYDRHVTGNRPIPGLITIGSTEVGEAKPPDSSQNIHAYREWRTRTPNYERMRNGEEFMEQKRRLEEKRQKLMMTALSYEEWMDHTEDRKSLIRKILQADFEQLKLLEEERLRMRAPRQMTHEEWKMKLQKRQEEERARREIQLKYQEEKDRWKKDFIRSSAAITHQEWLRQKELQMLRDKDKANFNNDKEEAEKKLSEPEKAYEAWLNKKHEQEARDLKSKIENERNLIETMRYDRSLSLVETPA